VIASFFLVTPPPHASGSSPPTRKRSHLNMSTGHRVLDAAALFIARFLEVEASMPNALGRTHCKESKYFGWKKWR
jgi:hypothetical protein